MSGTIATNVENTLDLKEHNSHETEETFLGVFSTAHTINEKQYFKHSKCGTFYDTVNDHKKK